MKRVVFLAVAVFCLVGLTDASAATLYVQSNVLRDDNGSCGGATRGKCTLTETGSAVSDNIKVKCVVKNAIPGSYTVFWTCTSGARGCHNQACGFVSLGTASVGGTGAGSFTTTLSNSPFPGSFVHLDLIGPDTYTAVFGAVPIGDGSAAANASPGDPTGR